MIPLPKTRNKPEDICIGCGHLGLGTPGDGTHCYMFREKPGGDFCGQNTLVQSAISAKPKPLRDAIRTLAFEASVDLLHQHLKEEQ